MKGFTLRGAVFGMASLGLLAACERSETLTAPAARASSSATLALEVSDINAVAGARIAVSLSNETSANLGGVQGTLRFNPSQLRYVGQLRDGSSDEILMVNDREASRGALTLVVADGTGIQHSQPILFEVAGAGYAAGLDFDVTDAMLNGSPVARVAALVRGGVRENRALVTTGAASTLSLDEWLAALGGQVSQDPGEIRPGLRFGDVNLNGLLQLDDALFVINVVVGNAELIIGTDGTGPNGDVDGVVAANVQPFNQPGVGAAGDPLAPGIETDGVSREIGLDDALAIVNEFVGNDQPVVGEIIPGRPLSPASNRVVVIGNITTNTTWTNGNIYELRDEVVVTGGATLTIEAGTRIEGIRGGVGQQICGPLPFTPQCPAGQPTTQFASTDGSAFYVARDGRINAVGTPLQPIVWTCTQLAGESARSKGCWGGISILGNASNNRGTSDSPIVTGRATVGGCVQTVAEGRTARLYGGCNDDDNSGIMQYNIIDYAGFRFTATNELNGLALYGVGRGTTIDHIQVHAGLDDGIEFFGGTVNARYLYLTANSDDSFDFTESFTGNVQFVIVQHDPRDSDSGLEMDNNGPDNNALPRSAPKLYNFTVVGKDLASTGGTVGNNSIRGLHVRVGAQPKMFNFIVQNFPFALDIDNDATCTGFNTAAGMEIAHSIFTQVGRLDEPDGSDPVGCAGVGGTEVNALQAAGTNLFPATSPLLSPLNVIVPDFRPTFGTAGGTFAPPANPLGAPAGFLDVTATYSGAVSPASPSRNNVPWYSGWTHGWASAVTP